MLAVYIHAHERFDLARGCWASTHTVWTNTAHPQDLYICAVFSSMLLHQQITLNEILIMREILLFFYSLVISVTWTEPHFFDKNRWSRSFCFLSLCLCVCHQERASDDFWVLKHSKEPPPNWRGSLCSIPSQTSTHSGKKQTRKQHTHPQINSLITKNQIAKDFGLYISRVFSRNGF